MNQSLTSFAYLVAAVLFILALRGLSHPTTSRQGNRFGMIGMVIAIAATFLHSGMDWGWALVIVLGVAIGGSIGLVVAQKIKMTALPQLVAAFHSLVGLAAVFVATSALNAPQSFGIGTPHHIHTESLIEMSIGLAIGAITFSGSLIAFAKLQALMKGTPITFRGQHQLNGGIGVAILLLVIAFVASGGSMVLFALIALLAFALGFLLIIPIGGADMPVVVSMLNSYSGWAASGIGFTIGNLALIVTGALVGSSGAILSYIMCKGMNRSIINVIAGGFGNSGDAAPVGGSNSEGKAVKHGSADDAAFIMKNASKVIVVPGYGMAVSQAQHALRELGDLLKEDGVEVKYAIHPVAGRMPGHMNVLLAEASVPYDDVFELEQINNEFATADVVYVIGANDVTNPAAKTNPQSPIYGMPILDVDKAKTVLFVKRGMSSGYAGVDNELFFRDNTMMLFGDAKKMTEEIVQALGH
ncbi:MAG: NAD(P)(+) transhydrogenase (Re/Si-specific) subunit beta [Rhodospirillales bacterium]|nr:NAD(P)(+) transhydrogenase (Re/Si-specific) subunit beta [Rhodospirillales bacterium]MDE2391992.1 NAD(P)(+) transhydrogenase (Re/Si-specific) subunit beta [Rhodospirillales bacterium]